ncbi:HNH endonuclease signature motif containing protein [Litoribrevibacter albus]|uniref:HNH nuclease domain-containing protein n=1 Tax=Litoribrevibacter albus TaxID=1473156 RepID=A0AA37SBQ1_9GAMM|nr:HNH endonuclease signature motif containing protein [Litoribrevibacter albus]GLQ31641.1 hypothetical protein GCM10007876_21200 [Litoribrevibacter albus]
MKGRQIQYSEQELCFIKSHCTLPRRELTDRFNAQFDRALEVSHIAALCKRKGWLTGRTGQFVKGEASWNAGTKGVMKPNSGNFKKGHVPQNHKPVGSERINVEGYVEIKTQEPNVYELKHRVVYQEHFGAIPPGTNVSFLDGDPLNCAPDNLIAISRAESLFINRSKLSGLTGNLKVVAKNLAAMNVKKHERAKAV